MCPIPFKSDQSSCFSITKSEKEVVFIFNFDPTILELDMDCVLADHEKHALCDIYIVEFVHDATQIIMREENMVVGIFVLLKHLSLY
jgi:hypothetical protein